MNTTYYVAGIQYSAELYHHGIKGQKWGIRRFQNEDGTLTAAGKERYSAGRNPINSYISRKADRYKSLDSYHDSEKYKRWNNKIEPSKEQLDSADAYLKNYIDSNGRVTNEFKKMFEKSRVNNLDYEECREEVKKMLSNSSDPFLRKPETQQRILDTWAKSIYESNSGDDILEYVRSGGERAKEFAELDKKKTSEMRKVGKEMSKIWKIQDIRERHKAIDNLYSSKMYKESRKTYDQYRQMQRDISDSIKLKNMKDIIAVITPETRDFVSAMFIKYWD